MTDMSSDGDSMEGCTEESPGLEINQPVKEIVPQITEEISELTVHDSDTKISDISLTQKVQEKGDNSDDAPIENPEEVRIDDKINTAEISEMSTAYRSDGDTDQTQKPIVTKEEIGNENLEPKSKGAHPKGSRIMRTQSVKSDTSKNNTRIGFCLSSTETSDPHKKLTIALEPSSTLEAGCSSFCCGDVDPPKSSAEERPLLRKKTRFAHAVEVLHFYKERDINILNAVRTQEPLAEEHDQQARSYRNRFKFPLDKVIYPCIDILRF